VTGQKSLVAFKIVIISMRFHAPSLSSSTLLHNLIETHLSDVYLLHLFMDLLNMLLTRSSRLEMLEEAQVAICLAYLVVYFSLWHYDTLDCT
jgi:hypothetical protein